MARSSRTVEQREDLVRRAGLWEQMTDLNKTAVLDAISKGRFGELGDNARSLFKEREKSTFKSQPKGS